MPGKRAGKTATPTKGRVPQQVSQLSVAIFERAPNAAAVFLSRQIIAELPQRFEKTRHD
jgi:hypothetical protein